MPPHKLAKHMYSRKYKKKPYYEECAYNKTVIKNSNNVQKLSNPHEVKEFIRRWTYINLWRCTDIHFLLTT